MDPSGQPLDLEQAEQGNQEQGPMDGMLENEAWAFLQQQQFQQPQQQPPLEQQQGSEQLEQQQLDGQPRWEGWEESDDAQQAFFDLASELGKSSQDIMIHGERTGIGIRCLGTVEKFAPKRGFGIIISKESNQRIFAHWSNILSHDKWPQLKAGMEVEFEVDPLDPKLEATNITAPGGEPITTVADAERLFRHLSEFVVTGTVVWFSKVGYGFVTTDTKIDWPEALPAGSRMYVSREDLIMAEGSPLFLHEGMRVQFRVYKPSDNKPVAAAEVTQIGGAPLVCTREGGKGGKGGAGEGKGKRSPFTEKGSFTEKGCQGKAESHTYSPLRAVKMASRALFGARSPYEQPSMGAGQSSSSSSSFSGPIRRSAPYLKPKVTRETLAGQKPAEDVQWLQTQTGSNDSPSVFVRAPDAQADGNCVASQEEPQPRRVRRSRWDDMSPVEGAAPNMATLEQAYLAQQAALQEMQGGVLDENQKAALEAHFRTMQIEAGVDPALAGLFAGGGQTQVSSGQGYQGDFLTEQILNALPQADRRLRTREVACRYFAEGRCSKGTECPFSHDPAVIQAMPFEAKKRKVVCRFFATGRCAKGDACVFLHEYSDPKAIQSAFTQTPCKFFALGSCSRGAECFYAHVLPVPQVPEQAGAAAV